MKKIAACYIRVSTDDQIEYSPESQMKEIQKFADINGYTIKKEFVFIDEGISGRNAQKRPKFNEMIKTAKIKPKPFEAVLLWKFSRFARNKTDAVVYKNLLRNQLGIEVISVSENLGDDKGTAVILESMFEAMDEYYSINLSTEVKRSMILKAEKGEVLCPAPYGYKNENKTYIPDNKQAETVKFIFDSYQSGKGFRTIAVLLSEMGIRTNRGNIPDSRFVEYILRNPVYTGKIRWSKNGKEANRKRYTDINNNDLIISKGSHTPIISEKQFNTVQEMIAQQKSLYPKHRQTKNGKIWLLKGLVRCDNCGGTLVHTSLKNESLQCHNYARGQCKVSHYVLEQVINSLVIDCLVKKTSDISFKVKPNILSNSTDLSVINKMLESESKRLSRAKEAFLSGIDTAEEYKETKDNITKRIAYLENERKKLPSIIKAEKDLTINLHDFLRSQEITDNAKNEALKCLIYEIVLYRPENRIDLVLRG